MDTESREASNQSYLPEHSHGLSKTHRDVILLENYVKSLQIKNNVQCIPLDILEQRIQQTATNVDYSKILDESSRVLFFGEAHNDLRSKGEVAYSLGKLKRMGYTALALEQVGTDKQDLLSRYITTGDSNDHNELLAYLKKVWGSYYGNQTASGYMEIIRLARYHKFDGIALGTVYLDDPEIEAEFSLQNRDVRLTNPLLKYIKVNPNGKVAAVTGAVHASRTIANNMIGILDTNGIPSQTLVLLDGEKNEQFEYIDDYLKAIRRVDHVNRHRVMVPNPGAISYKITQSIAIPLSFDYLIHVPHRKFL